MSQINLLPWREKERREKTVQFAALATLVAILNIVIILAIRIHVGTLVDYHKARNLFLQNEITILKTKLEKIKDLEKTKQNLLARMDIIQQLQSSRPEVVHLFEEIVTTVPNGVWITSIKQTNKIINIEGKAESNARVSAYMRNITESPWLKDPVLIGIDADDKERIANFKLTLSQDSPNKSGDEEEEV